MKDLLKTTRELLSQLGTEVVSIANEYSDVFSDPTINEQLNKFRLAYEEAIANLDSPTFRIATIGTTSSGKSTIINALIGRKIAPMEADEMSAGILTLSSSSESKMIIEDVEGAVWETGEWVGVSDEDLYTHIRDRVMLPYHEKRKLKELPAPQITVLGSLLPVEDPSLLNLPSGVNIEFVDLPGLKSVQDRINLKVIQKRVNKSFCLVALDYGQVDEQNRRQLLEELKKVVDYLQGRTDSMIFILNRVDLLTTGIDLPLGDRIAKLQVEIQDILSLPKLPDIIPFSSLLLYYAQCAWGATSQSESSQIDSVMRSKLLKEMLENCARIIYQRTQGKENRELDRWFQNIRYRLEDDEAIDDETMLQLLKYAHDWSGGKQFWDCLRGRLAESFPILVLTPILMGVLESYKVLAASINSVAQTRKLETKEEVEEQRNWVLQRRNDLSGKISQTYDDFRQDIEQTIEDLKKSDPNTEGDLALKFQRRGLQGFQSLIDAIREVEEDLALNLILPVRDALKNNSPLHELKEKLLKVVNPSLTKDITKAYDVASRRLSDFTESDGTLSKQVRKDDQKGLENQEFDERSVRKLYQSIRDAISARAEFMLQAKSKKFEGAVQSLVYTKIDGLLAFCQGHLPSFNLDDAIATEFKQSMSNTPLTLPSENLFVWIDPIGGGSRDETIKIGEELKTEYYESGSCYKETKTKVVTHDVMANISYSEIIVPDFDGMADQWAEGVTKGKDALWNSLRDWIVRYMNSANRAFIQSVDKMLGLVDRSLQEQLTSVEQNFESQINQWQEIESRIKITSKIHDELEINIVDETNLD